MNWTLPSPDALVGVFVAAMSLLLAYRKLRSANLPLSTRVWMGRIWVLVFVGATVLAVRLMG